MFILIVLVIHVLFQFVLPLKISQHVNKKARVPNTKSSHQFLLISGLFIVFVHLIQVYYMLAPCLFLSTNPIFFKTSLFLYFERNQRDHLRFFVNTSAMRWSLNQTYDFKSINNITKNFYNTYHYLKSKDKLFLALIDHS